MLPSQTYQVTITQTDRYDGDTPTPDLVVCSTSDWKMALGQFRDSVSRSQGEWSNYHFIGQSVKLLDHGKPVRTYVGTKHQVQVTS